MKILISGTYCSGKTTLAKLLNKSIDNSMLIEEPAREVLELLPNSVLKTEILRNYLLTRQILEEKKAIRQANIIICDAGIESNIAHNRIFESSLDGIKEAQLLNHDKYDFVFTTSIEDIQIIADDGERFIDPNLRISLDKAIKDVLLQLGYNPIILKGSVSDRLNMIKKVIGEKLLWN